MKPIRVTPTLALLGTSAKVCCEPKGVSLIVAPWNYPINLALGPLSSAIAAGCTAIIKPSEMAPELARVTREIIESAFDQDEVAVFESELCIRNLLRMKLTLKTKTFLNYFDHHRVTMASPNNPS